MTQLKYKDNGIIYRQIKKYRKILQKSYDKLDYIQQHWRPSFEAYLSEKELLERLLTYDFELLEAYNNYQQILRSIQTTDYSLFIKSINQHDLKSSFLFSKHLKSIEKKLKAPLKQLIQTVH